MALHTKNSEILNWAKDNLIAADSSLSVSQLYQSFSLYLDKKTLVNCTLQEFGGLFGRSVKSLTFPVKNVTKLNRKRKTSCYNGISFSRSSHNDSVCYTPVIKSSNELVPESEIIWDCHTDESDIPRFSSDLGVIETSLQCEFGKDKNFTTSSEILEEKKKVGDWSDTLSDDSMGHIPDLSSPESHSSSAESGSSSAELDLSSENEYSVNNQVKKGNNVINKYFTKISKQDLIENMDKQVSYNPGIVSFRQEEREETHFNFLIFSRHHKNIKGLTAKNMPTNFTNLAALLSATLPNKCFSSPLRQVIWNKSGFIENEWVGRIKAFLCSSFEPVQVGYFSASVIDSVKVGDFSPQFSLFSYEPKCIFQCEVCYPFNDWQHSVGRASNTTKTKLEGIRQVYEHYISNNHIRALEWWETNTFVGQSSNPVEIKRNLCITNFMKVSSNSKTSQISCLYLWDPEIVSELKDDKQIRRKQPKTLHQERKLWCTCKFVEGHSDCSNYKVWEKKHVTECRLLSDEANKISQSLYIAGNTTVILNGKSVVVKGGIKSVDPMCTGKSFSVGPHPYTCDMCHKQLAYFKNLISKRKASRLSKEGGRVGRVGFRSTYSTKVEHEKELVIMKQQNKELNRANISLKRVIFTRKTWDNMLFASCQNGDQEKLILDLLDLFSQPSRLKPLQYEVISNLVGKLRSGVNHRYTSIIKDIAALHKNRLGSANYSLLQSVFGLCGKTTAHNYTKDSQIKIGYNTKVLEKAILLYDNKPVVDTTDEARTLRYISPLLVEEEVQLVGQCWDANIDLWPQKVLVPRADKDKNDDFSALKDYVDKVIKNDNLAKSTAIHNFASLTGDKNNPLIYLVWPTPNSGYKASSLLKIWDKVRYDCFINKNGALRDKPINLLGHSSDSAGFQLSAARSLMTPCTGLLRLGVMYLSLGVGEGKLASPYLGPLPSTAYLDYDHELRLFLKCLKYSTLDLTIWNGCSTVLATVDHLGELKDICLKSQLDCPFTDSDLLFARYLDQNCDAALKVFDGRVADLLEQYVMGSEGTIMYIRAVVGLMSPFLQPSDNPNQMQKDISFGISFFRLWRKVVELKKWRLSAVKDASTLPEKRGKFLTYGCYNTAEILFTAATNHMLAMYVHFKDLGPEEAAPWKSGSKTTERIISEIQGKTNQIQCLDAQPTFCDIVHRVSKVQFNQMSEEKIIGLGGKKQVSTNRKRLSHSNDKIITTSAYAYPDNYKDFLEEQRNSHLEGIQIAQELFKKYCPEAVQYLSTNNVWDFLQKEKCVVPAENIFSGYLPENYGLNMLKTIRSHKYLGRPNNDSDDDFDDDSDDDSDDDKENSPSLDSYCLGEKNAENSDMSKAISELDNEEESIVCKNKNWFLTMQKNNRLASINIYRALKLLIPREYVSRERGRRHIAANFLPGLKPLDSFAHDIFKLRYIVFKQGSENVMGKVICLQTKGVDVLSVSKQNVESIMRVLVLEKICNLQYKLSSPLKITKWISVGNFVIEVGLDFSSTTGFFNVQTEHEANMKEVENKKGMADSLALAKQLQSEDIPLDYEEVEEIIERKIDFKTQEYVYLVKFKNSSDKIWLPKNAFYFPVVFNRRIKSLKEIQFALKDTVHNQILPTTKKSTFNKQTTLTTVSTERYADLSKVVKPSSNIVSSNDKIKIKGNLKKGGHNDFLNLYNKRKNKPGKAGKTTKTTTKKKLLSLCKLKEFIKDPKTEDSKHDSVVVYKDLELKQEHILKIEKGKWMDDIIMAAGIKLLKEQHSDLSGMQDTLNQKKGFSPSTCDIQILYNGKNHWLVASTIFKQVSVYDSIYREPCVAVQKQLIQLYKDLIEDNKLIVEYPSVQKQTGGNDCGLFALAFAYELAQGSWVDNIKFDQKSMRSNLLDSFSQGKLLPFSRVFYEPPTKKVSGVLYTIHIICTCRQPEFGDILKCGTCMKKFHKSCTEKDTVASKIFFCTDTDVSKVWFCKKCSDFELSSSRN